MSKKMVGFECPLDLLERVKRFADFEDVALHKVWVRAAEHCLDLPPDRWLRRKRKAKA